tara:strand:- start:155 stop:937 length:783 start_codon:yes stop_codon:yes gene_type:complete
LKILINCSNTKKLDPEDSLIWSPDQNVADWERSIASAVERLHPGEMYTGRAFNSQQKIILDNGHELWIMSAGLGVIFGGEGATEIPSYEATFSPTGEGPDSDEWGDLFSDTVQYLYGERLLLLVSPNYLRALEPHLFSIAESVTVFDPSSKLVDLGAKYVEVHPRFKEVMGSADVDHWTKVLELLLPDIEDTKRLDEINRRAQALPPRPKRETVTDEELREIVSNIPDSIKTLVDAVKHIRHELNVSAEYGRIRKQWKRK